LEKPLVETATSVAAIATELKSYIDQKFKPQSLHHGSTINATSNSGFSCFVCGGSHRAAVCPQRFEENSPPYRNPNRYRGNFSRPSPTDHNPSQGLRLQGNFQGSFDHGKFSRFGPPTHRGPRSRDKWAQYRGGNLRGNPQNFPGGNEGNFKFGIPENGGYPGGSSRFGSPRNRRNFPNRNAMPQFNRLTSNDFDPNSWGRVNNIDSQENLAIRCNLPSTLLPEYNVVSCTVTVGGTERIRAVLDSGASCSLIEATLARGLVRTGLAHKLPSRHPNQLEAATGTKLETAGTIRVELNFGNIVIAHDLVVVKRLSHQIILGVPFLFGNNCCIDLQKSELRIGKYHCTVAVNSLTREMTFDPVPVSALYTTKYTVLPPNSVTNIEVREGIYDPASFCNRAGFLTPNLVDVDLGTTFATINQGVASILVVNNSNYPRTIQNHTHIASISSPRYTVCEDNITTQPSAANMVNGVVHDAQSEAITRGDEEAREVESVVQPDDILNDEKIDTISPLTADDQFSVAPPSHINSLPPTPRFQIPCNIGCVQDAAQSDGTCLQTSDVPETCTSVSATLPPQLSGKLWSPNALRHLKFSTHCLTVRRIL